MKSRTSLLSLAAFLLGVSLNADVLTFSRAYELTLKNSNAVKSAEYMLESGKKNKDMESAALYPQINLSLSQKTSDYKYNVKAASPANRDVSQDMTSASLTFRQQLYNPELYAKIEFEKLRNKVMSYDVQIRKQELAKELFKTYLSILESKNKIELFKAKAEYQKYTLESFEKKYEMGLANKVDLLQMKVDHANSEIDLKKEMKLLRVHELMLKHFTGEESFEMPSIDYSEISAQKINELIASVSTDVDFSSNLEFKKALSTKEMIQKEQDGAFSAHYPKINLDASYAKFDIDNPTSDASYDKIQNISVTLSLPIYQGGYASDKVESIRLKKSAAQEDIYEVQKNKRVEYEELMSRLASSSESIDTYNEALHSAELYLESVSQSYEKGLKSIIDYHEARSKIYEVRYKYIENIYEMLDSYIGLMIIRNSFENLRFIDDIMRSE